MWENEQWLQKYGNAQDKAELAAEGKVPNGNEDGEQE